MKTWIFHKIFNSQMFCQLYFHCCHIKWSLKNDLCPKYPKFLLELGLLPDKTQISDFYHLILDFWLKMVQYSPVDIRIHHQSAADHQQIMHIWILCQNVLSGNISFSRNQDQKQNEVNRCLFPITMILSIDFRPFSEWKSENFQNVLSGNGGSGNHRMLLYCTDEC